MTYQPPQPQTVDYVATPGYMPADPYQQAPVSSAMEPVGYYGTFAQEHPRALTVFILGIIGIVSIGILGPIAWIMGSLALKDCAQGRYRVTDSLKIGRILGIIATCLFLLSLLGMAFFLFGLMAPIS